MKKINESYKEQLEEVKYLERELSSEKAKRMDSDN